jgi:recombination protein RecR
MASSEIEALTQALSRLPGLGPRSARRAVLHLLKKRESALEPLLRALDAVNDRLVTCGICGNVDTVDPCGICADARRDARALCVVEDVADLWALDKSRLFPGRFHVLGGRLSALEGVRPEDLSIDALVARVSAGGIDEVVLAMNATLEGQTTAHYLAERLEQFPVRLAASWTIWTKARWRRRCARAGLLGEFGGRLNFRRCRIILRSWPFFPSWRRPTRACVPFRLRWRRSMTICSV